MQPSSIDILLDRIDWQALPQIAPSEIPPAFFGAHPNEFMLAENE